MWIRRAVLLVVVGVLVWPAGAVAAQGCEPPTLPPPPEEPTWTPTPEGTPAPTPCATETPTATPGPTATAMPTATPMYGAMGVPAGLTWGDVQADISGFLARVSGLIAAVLALAFVRLLIRAIRDAGR